MAAFEQSNFDDYRMAAHSTRPGGRGVSGESAEAPGGIGEPGTSALAPALTNAIFAATAHGSESCR